MGWNNDNTVLTGPISLADIGRAAGYPSGQSGDNVFNGGWLIVNGLFNMWAKHKGFKSSAPGYAYDKTQATPELRSPLRVAAAQAANWGMGLPTENVLGDMTYGFLYKLYNQQLNWYYNRPTQGAPNERFRPMDFDGYRANAKALTIPIQVVSYNLSADNSLTIEWPQAPIAEDDTYQLRLSDMAINSQRLNNFYFGALIYDPNTGTWVVSAPDTIANNGLSVTFLLMGAYAGRQVDIVPFLSSGQIPSGQTPGGLTLLSFNLAPIRITVNAHTGVWETVSANGAYNPLGTTVTFRVRVKNNNSSAGNMDVTIRLSDTADGSHIVAVTTQQIRGLAQGQTADLTGSFSWTYDNTKSYFLVVDGTYGSGLSYEYLQQTIAQVRRPLEPEPVPSE